jgi:hypothetical protein
VTKDKADAPYPLVELVAAASYESATRAAFHGHMRKKQPQTGKRYQYGFDLVMLMHSTSVRR